MNDYCFWIIIDYVIVRPPHTTRLAGLVILNYRTRSIQLLYAPCVFHEKPPNDRCIFVENHLQRCFSASSQPCTAHFAHIGHSILIEAIEYVAHLMRNKLPFCTLLMAIFRLFNGSEDFIFIPYLKWRWIHGCVYVCLVLIMNATKKRNSTCSKSFPVFCRRFTATVWERQNAPSRSFNTAQ